ncbi:MAG TPA: hypothetical protein VK633_03740 [Verrucomicrobiae bacterium]|nr:hypothetical protein [Verrucomicrobiae bacterium]
MTGRIKKGFLNSKDSISNMQTNVADRGRRAARKTDYYVHDNAWTMMAVSAGLAFVAGFLLSRGNQEAIAAEAGTESPEVQDKVKKLNSWEFLHSSIPLALFAWKALQASRCARKNEE